MKKIIYCISFIIVAICIFILGQMQVKVKPAMIWLKTDEIVITDGIMIDSVDRERIMEGCVLEGCVLETINVDDKDYEKL